MHIRNRLCNNTPRAANYLANVGSGLSRQTILTSAIISVMLCACGKSEAPISTADRVKMVEERQKTDPSFYLEKKAAEVNSNKPATISPAVPATAQAEQRNPSAKM